MKTIEVTEEVRSYLNRAVEAYGSPWALSLKIGLSHTSITAWAEGSRKVIQIGNYAILLKALRPFMPDDVYHRLTADFNGGGKTIPNIPTSEVAPAPDGGKYPVICLAAAASVNTLAFPLADYASENSENEQYFPNGKPGDFAIEVTGSSMLPWYPEGTVLLVRPNTRINNGDRVVAILDNGEVVFKVYAQKGDTLYLFSIDEGGRDFKFPRGKWGQIRGLYRVIASVRDEERLDESIKKRGIRHRWEDKLNEEE